MEFLEIIAAIGLFAGDILAAVGLLGAAFLCLWMLAGKQMRRVPETMWMWAWAGTLLGGFCFVSILITQTPAEKIGFLFGWPPSLVGGLLAVAVALLGLSVALHLSRKPQPKKQRT